MITLFSKYKGICRVAALLLTSCFSLFTLESCIDEEYPTDQITAEQVSADAATQKNVLNGIAAYMVKYNSYGSSGYYYYDWGYPCEMFFRDLCTQDYVYSKNGTWNYWTYKENASSSGYEVYRWNYYYRLIKNCNSLIGLIDEKSASDDSKRYLGQALLFRALAYMDLAREFEFKPTGFVTEKNDTISGVVKTSYSGLDATADEDGIWGLTVPIVTNDMSIDEIQNNPRAPFYTMYRFIMTDLNHAIRLFGKDGYTSDDKSFPDTHVAYGLQARAWLEIGSRMDPTIEISRYLNTYGDSIAHYDKLNNGYDTLGVTTAAECYAKAAAAADSVIDCGAYTPLTKAEWTDSKTGFNSANSAWMWRCRIGEVEQEPSYYFSFPGTVCSEALTGLPYSYHAYRCISNTLYAQINDKDWRKLSWVSPDDAGKATADVVTKYNSLLSPAQFSNLDEYANLKFRPGQGDINTVKNWLIGDQPVMRVEEMYFIKAEAQARQGLLAMAGQTLRKLIQTRYTGAPYGCPTTTLSAFMTELMKQKRIEFWGEGLTYFDYKRLNMQIDRTDITNTLDANKIASKDGYCAPWLNFYIYNYETGRNKACKPNPDPSNYYTK